MARPIGYDRKTVLDQAMHVFWHNGFCATHMRDLTSATRLKPGSLYGAFPSKEALFRALFEERAERLARLTEEAVAEAEWHGAMRAWSDFFWEEKAFLELFLSEAWRNRERELLVQQFLHRIIAPLVPILKPRSENAELMGYALFGAIAVPALHLLKQPAPERALLDHLVQTLAGWIAAQML